MLLNPKLHGFATLLSGLTRTPSYWAEHLTAERGAATRDMDRVNSFHPEARLPEGACIEL